MAIIGPAQRKDAINAGGQPETPGVGPKRLNATTGGKMRQTSEDVRQTGFKMTHSQLIQTFKRYLEGKTPPGLIFTECALYPKMTAATGVRGIPDVIEIKKTYAFKTAIYEIKISRGDFLGDIRSGKWKKYIKQAKRFYFVTLPGVATLEDIPRGAGFYEYTGKAVIKGRRVVYTDNFTRRRGSSGKFEDAPQTPPVLDPPALKALIFNQDKRITELEEKVRRTIRFWELKKHKHKHPDKWGDPWQPKLF